MATYINVRKIHSEFLVLFLRMNRLNRYTAIESTVYAASKINVQLFNDEETLLVLILVFFLIYQNIILLKTYIHLILFYFLFKKNTYTTVCVSQLIFTGFSLFVKWFSDT